MDKKSFLKLLEKKCDILKEHDIKHDIPYVCIDKEEFNQIYILIPDTIQKFDIAKIYNCDQIKEKNQIIEAKIDDIIFSFIKTDTKDWNYTFYYYSWDILPVLINCLAKQFGLKYTNKGLFYKLHNYKITSNLKDIFDFFELNFSFILNGFTKHLLYNYIPTSPYFNYNDFNMGDFELEDKYFNFNKEMYKDFLSQMPNKVPDEMPSEQKIILIDTFFKKSNFLENIIKIEFKKEFKK